MCRVFVLASFFFTLLAFANAVHAQEGFSADVVELKRSGTPVVAKMYYAQERMRVEPQNMTPRNSPPIAFILYLKTQTEYMMLLRDRVYSEIPPAGDWQIYTSFRSGDVDDACSIWDKGSPSHSGACRKVGDDTINGRAAVKYEGRCSKGQPCYIWIDRRLRLLVKWENGPNGRELRNIQEGNQLPDLFEIPRGFKRVQATTGTMQSAPSR